MARWRCKVCDYVHEGPEPPETCPVCGVGPDEFVLLDEDGMDVVVDSAPAAVAAPAVARPAGAQVQQAPPKSLEEVRDAARIKLRGICGVYPYCDGARDRICQREQYGKPIGLGGAGTGSSFEANVESLRALKLDTRLVGPHFEASTETTFLGRSLAMPILGASTSGVSRYNNAITEADFCQATVQGCLDSGTLSWRGDTFFYTLDDHPGLASVEAAGGAGVPIFKPRAQDDLLRLIARAEAAGALAVGVDLDGCGSSNMARGGQPVYRKSLADMKALVRSTTLPFIFKGIMRPDDAQACVDAGAQVVAVSNHGGRVLDGTPGVAEVLPGIADRVGRYVTVTADGGVRTGYDVLKLLALGADLVLVGRDLIRASIGGGAVGVQLQMERLNSVLKRAMLMTGCSDVAAIGRHILV